VLVRYVEATKRTPMKRLPPYIHFFLHFPPAV